MTRLVQKFGGSSLKDPTHIKKVARIVADTAREGKELVVVVSAMGDTTDHLIDLAHRITTKPDPRELDVLLATGEQISIALLVMSLQSLGLKAKSFTGPQAGILTDETHGFARIKTIHTTRLETSLSRGEIAVVAGFQGMTRSSELTTLGRGGSDTTAVALAAALRAKCCDIYTDVDGVYTCDPRKIPKAKRLHAISYEEMLALASSGAQVLNARSVELAQKTRMPIRLRSTFSPQDSGTLVTSSELAPEYSICGVASNNNQVSFVLTLESVSNKTITNTENDQIKILNQIIDKLSEFGIEVHFSNNSSFYSLKFSCEKRLENNINELLTIFLRENTKLQLVVDNKVTQISLVGSGLHEENNLKAQLIEILEQANIPIKQVSITPLSISALIPEPASQIALESIHEQFCLTNNFTQLTSSHA